VSPIGYLPGRSLERRIEDLLDTTQRFHLSFNRLSDLSSTPSFPTFLSAHITHSTLCSVCNHTIDSDYLYFEKNALLV
jgi:hypothetical protein